MLNRSRLLILFSSALVLFLPLMAKADFDLKYMDGNSGHQSHSSGTVWREALERGLNRAIDPGSAMPDAPSMQLHIGK